MAFTLNSTIQNFRFRFVNGPAGQFFQWWGEELRNAMPARFRSRMQYARRRLLIQLGESDISLSVDDAGSIQSLDSFSIEGDPQLQQQRIRELQLQHELTQVSCDLLLPQAVVLQTQVVMPLAAESNLRQALSYEMDRHTPFQADEVFFNWRVLNRDRESGQVQFDLFATPREPVEAQLERLKKLGLAPTGIDVLTDSGPLGVNLLPEDLRFHIVNQQARLNWVLAAVTVFLLVIVMAQSLWLREHQVESIGEAIEGVRAEAMAVQQIRKQIEDATDAAGFLQERKIANGYKVEMLAELTGVLPSNTFLDRLSLQSEVTQMQGKSDNAQSLIELINDSPLFENASFRGPTRLDSRSRKEIFDLSADNIQQDAG
jgi:general secretion pathway protein L